MITSITLAELSAGPLVATTDEERAARQAHLQQAEADFEPLPFDEAAARSFGQVAASLRRVANDVPIHTCNPDDFSDIDGLTVIAVAHPDTSIRVFPPT